jgi:thioredoxin reductase
MGRKELKKGSTIIASGLEFKWLEVEGEYDLRGGGVSSGTTCDGFLSARSTSSLLRRRCSRTSEDQ